MFIHRGILGLGVAVLVVASFVLPSGAQTAESPLAMQWHIERVDGDKVIQNVSGRSLRLDTLGRPHVAYGGDKLYYASRDDTGWHTETVDDGPGVGEYASLGLDQAGNPQIAYYDRTHGHLKYAHKAGSVWQTETVDASVTGGQWASLAVDGNGNAHISYFDETHERIKYASQLGDGWQLETIDPDKRGGPFGELALDSHSNPHVVYRRYDAAILTYASWWSGQWYISELSWDTNLGVSIALDSNTAHISYAHSAPAVGRYLLYYTSAATNWTKMQADSEWVGDNSIAVDSAGQPHIAYYDTSNHHLKYAQMIGSSWATQDVDDVGYWVSLALDTEDNPHITYFDGTINSLKYAYWGPEYTPTPTATATETPTATPTPTPHRVWLPVIVQEYLIYRSGQEQY